MQTLNGNSLKSYLGLTPQIPTAVFFSADMSKADSYSFAASKQQNAGGVTAIYAFVDASALNVDTILTISGINYFVAAGHTVGVPVPGVTGATYQLSVTGTVPGGGATGIANVIFTNATNIPAFDVTGSQELTATQFLSTLVNTTPTAQGLTTLAVQYRTASMGSKPVFAADTVIAIRSLVPNTSIWTPPTGNQVVVKKVYLQLNNATYTAGGIVYGVLSNGTNPNTTYAGDTVVVGDIFVRAYNLNTVAQNFSDIVEYPDGFECGYNNSLSFNTSVALTTGEFSATILATLN